MTDVKSILGLMADGAFHSGAVLGEALGVSRTAVWKHLQKLDAYGVPLESVKGRGYRIVGGLDLLSVDVIRSGLIPDASGFLTGLEVFDVVESTNSVAMQRASEGGSGYVCLSEYQSGGRGRRGRTWVSPYGQNIYLSVVAQFDGGAVALEGLSLAVGVALVRALEKLGVTGAGLKWPNDVLVDGKKIAGILLEMTGDPAGVCQVVVGIGLNVALPEVAAATIEQPWTDLASQLDVRCDRSQVVAHLLNEVLPMLTDYERVGFSYYQAEWEARNVHAGQTVNVTGLSEACAGVVLGVSRSGALRLDVNGVEKVLHGGEISVRSAGV